MERRMQRVFGMAGIMALALAVPACEFSLGPGGERAYPQVPSLETAQLPAQVKAAYDESAAILALRVLQETNSSARGTVLLPPELVGSICNALVRVYAFQHPVRDTVVDLYAIRAFPRPTVREIVLGVMRTAPWLAPLVAHQRPTGNAQVDQIVAQYDLHVTHHSPMWGTNYDLVALRGPGPLNTEALAKLFTGIAGVQWSEPNGYVGDGNDIRIGRVAGGWRLRYSIGYGDCPAGCGGRTTWTFDVAADGSVVYIGRSDGGGSQG
jgi:hypothetical protein